jgi:hypothetical protein
MFFLWSLLHFVFIINSASSDQVCVSSCEFEQNFQSIFCLPPKCTFTRRDQCSVILKFNYQTQIVTVDFSSQLHKQRLDAVYKTDHVVNSVINLEETSFIQHTVEYYCSTGDNCDLDYVQNIAIPLYVRKSCQHFRSELIKYLHPNSSSPHRYCLQNNSSPVLCELACDIIYNNPDNIYRSCDGQVDLTFDTKYGQSTPINKPDYSYRSFAYACTSELCNGIVIQNRIQRLVDLDNGECMILLNETIGSTTSALPTTTTTTMKPRSTAAAFSKSFILIIVIGFFVHSFP